MLKVCSWNLSNFSFYGPKCAFTAFSSKQRTGEFIHLLVPFSPVQSHRGCWSHLQAKAENTLVQAGELLPEHSPFSWSKPEKVKLHTVKYLENCVFLSPILNTERWGSCFHCVLPCLVCHLQWSRPVTQQESCTAQSCFGAHKDWSSLFLKYFLSSDPQEFLI